VTTTSLPNTVPLDAEDRRIVLHGAAEFEGMRKAGRLAAETLDFITPHVKPGVTTGELDRLCHDFITGHGAVPAPLNYRGFTSSATASPATSGWSRATSSIST
jgi:methionyl aminopeptidase